MDPSKNDDVAQQNLSIHVARAAYTSTIRLTMSVLITVKYVHASLKQLLQLSHCMPEVTAKLRPGGLYGFFMTMVSKIFL